MIRSIYSINPFFIQIHLIFPLSFNSLKQNLIQYLSLIPSIMYRFFKLLLLLTYQFILYFSLSIHHHSLHHHHALLIISLIFFLFFLYLPFYLLSLLFLFFFILLYSIFISSSSLFPPTFKNQLFLLLFSFYRNLHLFTFLSLSFMYRQTSLHHHLLHSFRRSFIC